MTCRFVSSWRPVSLTTCLCFALRGPIPPIAGAEMPCSVPLRYRAHPHRDSRTYQRQHRAPRPHLSLPGEPARRSDHGRLDGGSRYGNNTFCRRHRARNSPGLEILCRRPYSRLPHRYSDRRGEIRWRSWPHRRSRRLGISAGKIYHSFRSPSTCSLFPTRRAPVSRPPILAAAALWTTLIQSPSPVPMPPGLSVGESLENEAGGRGPRKFTTKKE